MNFKYSKFLFNNSKDRKLLSILNSIKLFFWIAFLFVSLIVLIETRAFQLEKGIWLKVSTLGLFVMALIMQIIYNYIFTKKYKQSIIEKGSEIFNNSPYSALNIKYLETISQYKQTFKNLFISGLVVGLASATMILSSFLIYIKNTKSVLAGSLFIIAIVTIVLFVCVYEYYKAKRTSKFVINGTAEITDILELEKTTKDSDLPIVELSNLVKDESLGYLKRKAYLFPDKKLREKYTKCSKLIETIIVCFAPFVLVAACLFGYFVSVWSLITLNAIILILAIVLAILYFVCARVPLKEQKKIIDKNSSKYAPTKKLYDFYYNKKMIIINSIAAGLIYILGNLFFVNLILAWHDMVLVAILILFVTAIVITVILNLKTKHKFEKMRDALEAESEKIFGDVFKEEIKKSETEKSERKEEPLTINKAETKKSETKENSSKNKNDKK